MASGWWKRIKGPLETAEHIHFVDLALNALFHWHTWIWPLVTGIGALFVAAADGKSVSDVLIAVLLVAALTTIVAAGASGGIRWLRLRRVPSAGPTTVTHVSSVDAGPLEMNIGEDGPFYDIPKYSLYAITRRLKIELRNVDRAKTVTDCKVQITKIEPYSGYRGPWVLVENAKLTAGDQMYIPVAQLNEARDKAKYACGDDTIAVCVESKAPLLPAEVENRLTIRATGHDTPYVEVVCKLWVDAAGHLRIAKADPQDDFIPLLEAATRAYEQTRNDRIASFAVANDATPDGILRWYCYALVIPRDNGPLMQLFGTRPPSRVQEQITFQKWYALNVRPPDVYVMENGRDLFSDLSVRTADLPAAVSTMKSWANEGAPA